MGKYQVMPPMTADEFAALKEDIRHKGMLVPVEYDVDGHIIDGHHRYQAFSELIEEGADIPMFDKIVRRFDSEEAKLDYVISLNVKRRHMSTSQRQELVVKLRKPPYLYTMSKIAQLLGTSIKTVSTDIDALPPAERAELKALIIKGADGREYTANYAPRVISTGQQALKAMQQAAVQNIAANVKTQGFTYTAEETAVIRAGTADTAGATTYANAPTAVKETPSNTEVPKAASSAAISDSDASKRISAFAWYGGKMSHLSWLLPLLPPSKHFVDLFGGSAAVLMNKEPSPIETYNDLDKNVVNFFRVLREQPDELARLLYMTPYSREERRIAYLGLDKIEDTSATAVERARQFFVLARQTRSANAQARTRMLNAWRTTRERVQNGMATYNAAWDNAIDGLAAVAARLKGVQIENYPALKILDLYDTPETLVYADPPYVHETRRHDHLKEYTFEMTDADHRALSERLHKFTGLVALSGYASTLYDELYADWSRIDMPSEATAGVGSHNAERGGDASRMETLWTNYPLVRS